jgi:ferredoxin-NADP reductase
MSNTLSAVVRTQRLEAHNIISLELVPAAGQVFPAFEPGAHIDVHLPGFVRHYSLLNAFDAASPRYVVAVLKDAKSRGGSKYIHEQLRVGQTLQISQPRNNFKLDAAKPAGVPTVLLAGGIGVTPLLGMMRELRRQAQPVKMIYCARSQQGAAYLDELQGLCGDNVSSHIHFDDAQGAPDLAQLLAGLAPETRLYACGPSPMLDAFVSTCAALGYTHAHIERFAAAPLAQTETAASAQGYAVTLQKTGVVVQVPPGKSILDALLDAGHNPDFSCGEGVCGSCETRIISGDVEHRDSILSASEQAANKSMMICVSRCRSGDLVLDL